MTQDKCKGCGAPAVVETAVHTSPGSWRYEPLCDGCYHSYNVAVANHWKKHPWAYGQVRLG